MSVHLMGSRGFASFFRTEKVSSLGRVERGDVSHRGRDGAWGENARVPTVLRRRGSKDSVRVGRAPRVTDSEQVERTKRTEF